MSGGEAKPVIAVVMGVSGSGKSTVGRLLARGLDCPFIDADSLHSPENVAKMQAGTPLTDDDRRAWLERIAAEIDRLRSEGKSAVLACSALKRAYRSIIVGERPEVILVYLKGSQALIKERIAGRHGHFMPASLLQSQFETLQEPAPDEHAIAADIAPPPEAIARTVLQEIELRRRDARQTA